MHPCSGMITPMGSQDWNARGYVPHYDPVGAIQIVTFRTCDSLPTHVVEELASGLRTLPPSVQRDERERRTEDYLASGHGECLLGRRDIAEVVSSALKHYDGIRYHLIAWCIMPNHVHVVVKCVGGNALRTVVHGWKSFSANEANRRLGRSGRFWMPDYFDRVIRDDDHLWSAIEYVHANPVRAGLCTRAEDWEWSSIHEHRAREFMFEQP